jgi:hypothetical protein
MAFDNVFAGPPTTGAPGTIKSPSLGVDVTNNNLYVSSGSGWQEVGSGSGGDITALTGDVTATGPGSAVATLPVVNANVGSFLSANITVNAKGQVTAAAHSTGITAVIVTASLGTAQGSMTFTNGILTASTPAS